MRCLQGSVTLLGLSIAAATQQSADLPAGFGSATELTTACCRPGLVRAPLRRRAPPLTCRRPAAAAPVARRGRAAARPPRCPPRGHQRSARAQPSGGGTRRPAPAPPCVSHPPGASSAKGGRGGRGREQGRGEGQQAQVGRDLVRQAGPGWPLTARAQRGGGARQQACMGGAHPPPSMLLLAAATAWLAPAICPTPAAAFPLPRALPRAPLPPPPPLTPLAP